MPAPFKPALVAGACGAALLSWWLLRCFAGHTEAFASRGTNPVVAFTVTGVDRKGRMVFPQSKYWTAKDTVGEDGVPCRVDDDGFVYVNVSSVGFQLQASASAYPELELGKLAAGRKQLLERQQKAQRWLEQHRVVLDNGGHTWHYNFPLNFNNILVTTDWPSAFAQAAVIHGYLVAHRVNGDRSLLDLGRAAAMAYGVDADHGGLTSRVDGMPFYEEVPLGHDRSPHILNGHLYSTVMLWELAEATGDPAVRALADAGIGTARRTLHLFDQGYWTRYDLRPRVHEVPLALRSDPRAPVDRVRSCALVSPAGNRTELHLRPGFRQTPRASTSGAWEQHDDGNGWRPLGETFLGLALPDPEVDGWLAHPGWELQVTYRGSAEAPPEVAILGLRKDLENEYFPARRLGVRDEGGELVARYRVGLEDLGWSHLQLYYVQWHTALVGRLWEITGDPVFRVFLARWTGYQGTQASDLAARNGDVVVFRDRPYDGLPDVVLDRALVEALDGLPRADVTPRNLALALLRYTFFRLALGANPHSRPADMIGHGKGSCLHYAVVYQALCGRAGLRCRIWNLYEIPRIGGHNLCEVWLDGRWCAMDPGYGAFFTTTRAVDGPFASVRELLDDGAASATCWLLRDRKRPRGQAPPPVDGPLSAQFESPERLPATYPAPVIFATPKAGVRGQDLQYEAGFEVDLAPGPVLLGSPHRTGGADAWSGLLGLPRSDGSTVSLHELGVTRLHTVSHRYTLRGLEPGAVYAVDYGICHGSRAGIAVEAAVADLHVSALPPRVGAGHATASQLGTVYFRAAAGQHDLALAVREGSVLLDHLRFRRTELADLPGSCAVGARIVGQSPFYDGHGPENGLDGVPDDDYVAAREGTLPNGFTFELAEAVVPVALDVAWNSAREYATDFALFAVDADGGERTLLDVRDNRPDRDRFNRLRVAADGPARRFRFEVRAAAGQDRLLLTAFDLIGARAR